MDYVDLNLVETRFTDLGEGIMALEPADPEDDPIVEPVGIALFSKFPELTERLPTDELQLFTVGAALSHPGVVPANVTVTPSLPADALPNGGVYGRLESDNSLSLVYKRDLGDDEYEYAPLILSDEDDYGWAIEVDGGSGDAQEVITHLAIYAEGLYDFGAYGEHTDPVIFYTRAGLGNRLVVYNGSFIGVTDPRETGEARLLYPSGVKWEVDRLLLKLPPAPWESAQTLHAWVRPNNVNYIENPRVLASGEACWNVVSAGTPSMEDHRFVVGESDFSVQSNLFPLRAFWASVVFTLGGVGSVQPLLRLWEADYCEYQDLPIGDPIELSDPYVRGDTITYDFTAEDDGPVDMEGLATYLGEWDIDSGELVIGTPVPGGSLNAITFSTGSIDHAVALDAGNSMVTLRYTDGSNFVAAEINAGEVNLTVVSEGVTKWYGDVLEGESDLSSLTAACVGQLLLIYRDTDPPTILWSTELPEDFIASAEAGAISLGDSGSRSWESISAWTVENFPPRDTSFSFTLNVPYPWEAQLVFDVTDSGGDLWLDKVMVCPLPSHFTYFDGNDPGDDYRWQGAENSSFSVWYNNYQSVIVRLFGGEDTDGLLSTWVPTGAAVVAHTNTITDHDYRMRGWRGPVRSMRKDIWGTEHFDL